jgi:hypothetical protein
MRAFQCDNCSSPAFFENRVCGSCGFRLGFDARDMSLHAVSTDPGTAYRFCANAAYDSCNWLIPANSGERLCAACRHNRTIPDIDLPANLNSWRNYELAKHRLFYSLIKLRLPLANRTEDPEHGLAFDFLAETPGAPVITGHENGVIVMNLKEADDSVRASQRLLLGEPYRTLLGHLRHESGHYYWDRLVADSPRLDTFRELFGDERADYDKALQTHYSSGPAHDWQSRFISAYASSHPWEDFAETWAHYFHIEDTMEMAASFGLPALPFLTGNSSPQLTNAGFGETISRWSSLTVVMNSLNRCMGEADLYPFVLPPPALSRLEFVHDLLGRPSLLGA